MKFFKSLKNQATSFLDQYKTQNPATFAAAQQAVGGLLVADGLFGLENPFDGQNKRPGIFGAVVAMIFGVVFIIAPGFLGDVFGVNKQTAFTTATVEEVHQSTSSDGGSSCSITAKYTVNGQEYTKPASYSSSSNCSASKGETLEIKYDPAQPGAWSAKADNFGTFMKIFFWAGILIVVSSIFTFFVRLISIIFGWKLLRDGRKNAASLPPGTDLNSMIAEIKKNFAGSVFNFPQAQPLTPPSPQTPPTDNRQ